MGRTFTSNWKRLQENKKKEPLYGKTDGKAAFSAPKNALKDAATAKRAGAKAADAGKNLTWEAKQSIQQNAKKQQQTKIAAAQKAQKNATDRRSKAAANEQMRRAKYPLSTNERKTMSFVEQDEVRRNKARWDRGQAEINRGNTTKGNALQRVSHRIAEINRSHYGFSGGESGADYLLPLLSEKEEQTMTERGKRELRSAKLNYDMSKEDGDDYGLEWAKRYAAQVRGEGAFYDKDALADFERSVQRVDAHGRPIHTPSKDESEKNRHFIPNYAKAAKDFLGTKERVKRSPNGRTDAHGRPMYTPDEQESEGQRNFFTAPAKGLAGSVLSLAETAQQATRNAIANRNDPIYQSANSAYDLYKRKAASAETDEERAFYQKKMSEMEDRMRAFKTNDSVSQDKLGQRLMRESQEGTQKVLDSVDGGLGKLVTQAAMSGLQMAPALATAPFFGGASLGIIGAQAAGQKAHELSSRGVGAGEALGRGLVSGGIEALTEKIPLNNLVSLIKTGGGASFLKTAAKQAGIEASEESASYIMNWAADKAAKDPEAQMSLSDLVNAAAVGGVSGAMFGGAGHLVGSSAHPSAQAKGTIPKNPLSSLLNNENQVKQKVEQSVEDANSQVKQQENNIEQPVASTFNQGKPVVQQGETIQKQSTQPEFQQEISSDSSNDPVQFSDESSPVQQALNENSTIVERNGRKYKLTPVDKSDEQALPEGRGAMSKGGAGRFASMVAETPAEGFHPINESAYARTEQNRMRARTEIPTVNLEGRLTSKTASTLANANITPNELVNSVEQVISSGGFSRIAYSDQAALNKATGDLRANGFDSELSQWRADVLAGKASKDITAKGIALYNEAANTRKDTISSMDILSDMVSMGKSLGQGLQAMNMINRLSPEGQLYCLVKNVEKMERRINERSPKKQQHLDVNQSLVDAFLNAESEEARQAAMEDICKDIGSQIPATWQDKFDAWRYFSMLFNPRTHVRNIGGNMAFLPARVVKNFIATAAETVANPKGRTKAFLNYASAEDRALVQTAWNDYGGVAERVNNGGKFEQSTDRIEKYKKTFQNPLLEKLTKFSGDSLNTEDMWFSKPAYTMALARYLKANKISAADFASLNAERRSQAQSVAILEAQKATYKDNNAFSDAVASLSKAKHSKNKAVKAISYGVEGVLPFKRTPANVAVRAVDYSPIGLAVGIKNAVYDVSNGTKAAVEAIDQISAGLTGTGLVALGFLLTRHGLISGGGDPDEKQDKFNELQGIQNYALNIGDKSYTLDWMAPSALPFFVGTEIHNAIANRDDVVDFDTSLGQIMKIAEPMLEMSMLQSLNDLIENIRFSQSPSVAIVAQATTGYLSQFIPTLFGQIERATEGKRYTTYIDRDSGTPKSIQYLLGRTFNKLPGEYHQVPYLDAWGREQSTGTPAERIFNNFLNPSYVKDKQAGPVESELQRLYDASYEDVLPNQVKQSDKLDGNNMTAEQWSARQKEQGKTAYDIFTSFISTGSYKSMTDKQKVKFIGKIFDFASAKGKEAAGGDTSKFDSWIKNASKAQADGDMSPEKFVELYSYKSAIDDETGDETAKSIKQGTWEEYVNGRTDLSDKQKTYVLDNVKFWNMAPANSGAYQKAKKAGYETTEEIQALLDAKKAMDTNSNQSYTNYELYSGILASSSDPKEQEKMWNALKDADNNKSWGEVSQEQKANAPVRERGEQALAGLSEEKKRLFAASGENYNTNSYTGIYDTLMAVDATDAEREAYYNYVNSLRSKPWKKGWSGAKAKAIQNKKKEK